MSRYEQSAFLDVRAVGMKYKHVPEDVMQELQQHDNPQIGRGVLEPAGPSHEAVTVYAVHRRKYQHLDVLGALEGLLRSWRLPKQRAQSLSGQVLIASFQSLVLCAWDSCRVIKTKTMMIIEWIIGANDTADQGSEKNFLKYTRIV